MNTTIAREFSIESIRNKKKELTKKARKNREVKVIGSGTVVVEYNVDKNYFADVQKSIEKFYNSQK